MLHSGPGVLFCRGQNGPASGQNTPLCDDEDLDLLFLSSSTLEVEFQPGCIAYRMVRRSHPGIAHGTAHQPMVAQSRTLVLSRCLIDPVTTVDRRQELRRTRLMELRFRRTKRSSDSLAYGRSWHRAEAAPTSAETGNTGRFWRSVDPQCMTHCGQSGGWSICLDGGRNAIGAEFQSPGR
jgi:hypothetical protein